MTINIAAFTRYQKSIDGGLAVYICEDYVCQQPQTDLNKLNSALKQVQESKFGE